MICVVQRVTSSQVVVESKTVGVIADGLNLLLGVVKGDTSNDANKIINKLVDLRIFNDEQGKMNLSVKDIKGSALVISQFTLAGSVNKGRRPSFDLAEEPTKANNLYEFFCTELAKHIPVEKGIFAADMQVEIHNDGPVTFILDSTQL
ncbi:MAG: D-aminoacyl-tRNA deacylase [Candidatus Riflemargulisbacteria bacterium]